jgi:hypothetical protein
VRIPGIRLRPRFDRSPLRCFSSIPKLSEVTFEAPSRLKKVESEVFLNSPALKSFTIPPSVSVLDGATFVGSSIPTITVDDNANFLVCDDFLIATRKKMILRHFKPGVTWKFRQILTISGLSAFLGPKIPADCQILRKFAAGAVREGRLFRLLGIEIDCHSIVGEVPGRALLRGLQIAGNGIFVILSEETLRRFRCRL